MAAVFSITIYLIAAMMKQLFKIRSTKDKNDFAGTGLFTQRTGSQLVSEHRTFEVACFSFACSTKSLYDDPLLLCIFSFSICSTKAFCFAFNKLSC